jgi:hypothetical protein
MKWTKDLPCVMFPEKRYAALLCFPKGAGIAIVFVHMLWDYTSDTEHCHVKGSLKK